MVSSILGNDGFFELIKRRYDDSLPPEELAEYHGITNERALADHLKHGELCPVLKALWTEEDVTRKVEWLRANANDNMVLLLERALAEIELGRNEAAVEIAEDLFYRAFTVSAREQVLFRDSKIYKKIPKIYFRPFFRQAIRCAKIVRNLDLLGEKAIQAKKAESLETIEKLSSSTDYFDKMRVGASKVIADEADKELAQLIQSRSERSQDSTSTSSTASTEGSRSRILPG